VVDGIAFASKREATRYRDLRLLAGQGLIRDLKLQVPYNLMVNGLKVCQYRADFTYEEYSHGIWTPVVEDSKGYRTAEYKLKRKLLQACFGITIRET